MKLLFDTHLLLWAAIRPDRLPPIARGLIEDAGNDILFSAASIWEVSIKKALGRPDFQVDSRLFRQGLLGAGYNELPITSAHAVAINNLPSLHKDPFDRLLIAQAMVEDLYLVTADPLVGRYPGPIRLV